MQEFDRAALVRRAEARQRSGLWFWGAVAALPVIGIGAGLLLGVMPSGTSEAPFDLVEAASPAAQAAPAESAAPGFSALAELRRYDMVTRTLRHCAQTGPAAHYQKAANTYRDANFSKTAILRDIAVNEPPEYDLSAFENELPSDPAQIMFQGLTGQIAVNALQRASQFGEMMADIDRQQDGYLGDTPRPADCTQFRNEVIMGKHNLSLPPAG